MLNRLIHLLFPPVSLTGTPGVWVTDAERRLLAGSSVILDIGALRARGILHVDRVMGARDYGNPVLRRALHTFKYRRVPALQAVLGAIMAEQARGFFWPGWVIVPVPLHWSRAYWRGFNQAELLAQALSHTSGAPVQNLLMRTRATGHQMGRGREERLLAVRQAFRSVQAAPRRVLLVDDVCTTGATLDACAAALRAAGAERVEAMVLAVER